MSYETLCLLWFLLLGVLLIGYAILDGFDLGVGILHPFVPRSDHDRRVLMNSIGPLWDGNEVWLVTFGGAMFAMFPMAYATIFSAFYTAFMALLFALIFRAVSLEFRSKMHSAFWRRAWDGGFFIGSTLAALLFGVAVGNLMLGMPLDEQHEYTGSLADQLNPYALLTGAMTVALLAMHGSIFLYLKTEGELQERIHRTIWRTFGLFLVMFIITTGATLVYVPGAVENFKAYPVLWVVPVLNVLAIANIPRAIYLGRPGYAFVSSSCTIAALAFLLLAGVFPDLVPASNDAAHSLNIYNAASSAKTLTIGLIIVALGMPCVLTYTVIIYWTFRGKVELGEHSY
ncbi:MAG: cytochrome d ubiquinol oxidase subunit II [Planctomycetes bacterium]|jgi:cytochrome d ubiquinol oxidase subunit II|nr:cytochrome d ubiquinol oxidase subunit II [Planctomycetota bacterium]